MREPSTEDIYGARHNTIVIDTDLLFRIADTAEEEGNFDVARLSFERGATLGSVECLIRLAYIFEAGLGVEIDKSRAMALYQRAWRLGKSGVAANNIAILYKEVGNHRSMFRWFLRAAQTGDGCAQLDLAKCYLNGVGVKANPQAALACLQAALRSPFISENEKDEAEIMLDAFAIRPA